MLTLYPRVRTLTGKEIELDIEIDYKVLRSRPNPADDGIIPLIEELFCAGLSDQGKGRGEGRHPADAAASHPRRQANVSTGAAATRSLGSRTISEQKKTALTHIALGTMTRQPPTSTSFPETLSIWCLR